MYKYIWLSLVNVYVIKVCIIFKVDNFNRLLQRTVISCETYIGAQVQTLCNFQAAKLTYWIQWVSHSALVILVSSMILVTTLAFYMQEKDKTFKETHEYKKSQLMCVYYGADFNDDFQQ